MQHFQKMAFALGADLCRASGILVACPAKNTLACRLSAPLDAAIDITARIGGLRVAQRQIVEIAKAMCPRARIIVEDAELQSTRSSCKAEPDAWHGSSRLEP